jgi:hypothetical protein
MDNSHVALVAVKLHADGFALYRCDRPIPLGVNLGSLTKVLKCAKDDDKCTLKANDDADVLSLKYEAHRASTLRLFGRHPSLTVIFTYHRRRSDCRVRYEAHGHRCRHARHP